EMEFLAILPNQCALAGCEVEQERIVPSHVAIVEADRDLVGDNVRPVRRQRTDIGEGREIPELRTAGIDNEQVQIFIPVLIVEKHDVATVRTPTLPVDRSAPGGRHGLACRNAVDRGYPDVQNAVDRGE